MEKKFLDRRLAVLEDEGVVFRAGVNVGVDVSMQRLRADYDAILLAGGAGQPRDLPVPGRELTGIHFAMDYLTLQNRRNEGDVIRESEFITAKDKHVIIIGGGDTGADCLGTAHRQGALSVHQLELMPTPPEARAADNPWPQWPQIFRISGAHEEGGERMYAVSTQRFTGDADGHVRRLHAVQVELVKADPSTPLGAGGRVQFQPVAGTEFELPADLVLLAMGFVGAEKGALLDDLGVTMTDRGNVGRDARWMTNVPGVFTAGDMQRGQSLIVWAIAEGRSAARAIDQYLMGESQLPAPLA
jgi:glutamate synthase (NADPH/NADH) small chain